MCGAIKDKEEEQILIQKSSNRFLSVYIFQLECGEMSGMPLKCFFVSCKREESPRGRGDARSTLAALFYFPVAAFPIFTVDRPNTRCMQNGHLTSHSRLLCQIHIKT